MEEKEDTSNEKNNSKTIIITVGIIVILIIIGIFVYTRVTKENSTHTGTETKSNSSSMSVIEEENSTNINTNANSSTTLGVPSMMRDDKPIIYLYPIEETKVNVKLGYSNKIICSYPLYENGWNVLAKPNGDLIDLNTGRNLYSLYYESEDVVNFGVRQDGFIVEGRETAKFLEEKLSILGLTEREAEEFIVYWLPRLQENKYNYIRFATTEEINANMPLNFSVEPDTLIRVLMTYKRLDKPIDIQEQKLETHERRGFVAVEWGGTEIK